MTSDFTNSRGQKIGRPLPDWKPVSPPPATPMAGTWGRLESLRESHVADLFEAFAQDIDGSSWTYQPYGPFKTPDALQRWIEQVRRGRDTQLFAVIDGRVNRPRGMAAFMSFKSAHGSIEIGHIHYGPELQQTAAGTEAIILMMRRAFSFGYRRLEWRCHALNDRSRRAAERLGFTFEGVFRNSSVQKGHSRDTAWYSITDEEWPSIDRTFDTWLAAPSDKDGTKKLRLSELMAHRARTASADAARDPAAR